MAFMALRSGRTLRKLQSAPPEVLFYYAALWLVCTLFAVRFLAQVCSSRQTISRFRCAVAGLRAVALRVLAQVYAVGWRCLRPPTPSVLGAARSYDTTCCCRRRPVERRGGRPFFGACCALSHAAVSPSPGHF